LPGDKEAPPDPLTAALRMLARRPYSVAEMRRALEKKYPDSSQVPKAIARLRELHYLDDKKFAEHYASSLVRNRAYGRYRIRRELKAKLVDYRQIEPALQQAFGETSERELLEQALAKKLRTLRLPLTRPRFHSLCQSLLRRGFNSGDIIKAVRARPELRPVAEEVEAADLESGEKGNFE
jgi:regulatory protein